MGIDILNYCELNYYEAYSYGARNVARRAQGACNRHGAAAKRRKDIQNNSDATLSPRDVMHGVKRLPSSYDALPSGH